MYHWRPNKKKSSQNVQPKLILDKQQVISKSNTWQLVNAEIKWSEGWKKFVQDNTIQTLKSLQQI